MFQGYVFLIPDTGIGRLKQDSSRIGSLIGLLRHKTPDENGYTYAHFIDTDSITYYAMACPNLGVVFGAWTSSGKGFEHDRLVKLFTTISEIDGTYKTLNNVDSDEDMWKHLRSLCVT